MIIFRGQQFDPHARLSLATAIQTPAKPTIKISMDCTNNLVQVECDCATTLVIHLTCGERDGNLCASGHGREASEQSQIMDNSQFVGERKAVQPVVFAWSETVEAWSGDARRQQFSPVYIEKINRALDRLRIYAEVERVEQIDMGTIRRYLSQLEQHGAEGKGGVGAKTLNNYLTSYQAFFEWCKKNEYVPASWRNPCKDINPAKTRKKQARALKLDEALGIYRAALIDEASEYPKSRHHDGRVVIRSAFYWVLICTGIRVSTAEHLRVRHFDLESTPPKINIPAFNAGKNSRERSIVISEQDRAILSEHFANHRDNLAPNDLALTRPQPRILMRDAKNAGVLLKDKQGRNLGFHCFRRFHATQLLRIKTDPKLVQQRLGHRDISTTMEHYNDVQAEDQIEVANALAIQLNAKISPNPLDMKRKSEYIKLPHHSEDASKALPPEIHPVNPHGIDSKPNDADQKLRSPTEVGVLPRSSRQEDEIGMRGLEPLITDSQSIEREAISLLRDQMDILRTLLDRR